MKKSFFYLAIMLFAVLFTTSCKDDKKDDPIVIDNPVYGFQFSGTATDGETIAIDEAQMVEPSSDYSTKVTREGMNYTVCFLKAGDISFKEVTKDDESTYGVANAEVVTTDAEAGEEFSYTYGDLVKDATDAFTVAEEGLYYVMTDETTMKFWIMKIENFEINATGDKIAYESGNADKVTFKTTEPVELRSKFKLRMNTAWKIVAEDVPWTDLDAGGAEGDHCRPVISYGGTVAGITPDGDDIEIETNGKLLNFTIEWIPGSKGVSGLTITTEEAGVLPPPEFPETMYMVGASLNGWVLDTDPNDAIAMIPVHSNPHLFWRVVWVEAGVEDAGFKFSPELDWGPSFGIDAAAGATDGVYAKGSDNVPDVAESGYYMVVVNLKEETVEVVTADNNVFAMGIVFGDTDWAGIACTVDNASKVIVSPAMTTVDADNGPRLFVKAATLTNDEGNPVDWWQAEFMVLNGVIEYRGTGDDQDRVEEVVGHVISMNFKEGTGTVGASN